MNLILASSSKPRQDIFKNIGWKYEVVKSLVEEKSESTNPSEYVKDLSRDKANSVAGQINKKAIIVSADTVIYMDGKIYEKPKSKEEAYQNMKEMSGKCTFAITGVTIKDLYQDKEICFSDTAEVYIKTAVGGDDEFWQQEDVIAIQKIAILALAGAYYDYRVALQDVMTYPINLTLNAIISQLRGKLALYEEGDSDA